MVIRIIPASRRALSLATALLAASLSWTQIPAASSSVAGASAPQAHTGETLYSQLRSVGLDKSRVYKVRDVSLDRSSLHISFEDGTIAFTEDVAGRVTGAFFFGDGEVLLVPPDQAERASVALFTGAAILEERFASAYFRFNDNTFGELQPSLRPADHPEEFITQWNSAARNLAEIDALRLLLSFSKFLPSTPPAETAATDTSANDDRMLHARVQGLKLGTFDLYYDSFAAEQIWAGQLKTVEGDNYYDVWTSFSPGSPGRHTGSLTGVLGEEAKPDEVRVSQYKIQAKVEPPTKLEADASLQVEVRQGGERAVLFELSRFLQIKSVEADGQPVEFIHNQALEGTQLARRGNDSVAVIFPQALRTGQKLNLHFVYGGEVLSEAGAGLLYVGARGTWYPNRGLEMTSFDLQFRYPVGWTLVATGSRVQGEAAPADLRPGEESSRWVSDRPLPIAGFNLGKYSRVVAHAGDVQVEAYATTGVERTFPRGTTETLAPPPAVPFQVPRPPESLTITLPPPSPARNAQAVANLSARAVEYFAARFGPFPYSSLALTQMPGKVSQGWPSLIFLSSVSFLTPQEKSQLHMSAVTRALSDNVIAHETAHQWWGDLVAWKSYRDQWLSEALANYSALMMLESDSPAQFREVMEKYRQDLLSRNKEGSQLAEAGPVTFGLRLSCSHFPSGYEAISYGRGTWLFHMLRYMMRDAERSRKGSSANISDAQADAPFLRALGKMRQRFQGKSVNTREVIHLFEEELPPSLWFEHKQSLDWFYQGWVNGTALPRLELKTVKFVEKPGSVVVAGSISQDDAPKDLVTPVPVYALLPGRSVLLGQVFADGPETSFHLSAPVGTRRIVLDPNQT
ncbi:MAG: M1 family metallopeptidase, partial [Terriglobales bacterium]